MPISYEKAIEEVGKSLANKRYYIYLDGYEDEEKMHDLFHESRNILFTIYGPDSTFAEPHTPGKIFKDLKRSEAAFYSLKEI